MEGLTRLLTSVRTLIEQRVKKKKRLNRAL